MQTRVVQRIWHLQGSAQSTAYATISSDQIPSVICKREKSKFMYPVPTSSFVFDGFTRYINMDYLFFCSMLHSVFLCLMMSYDIVCQWYLHLWERMLTFPHHFHIDLNGKKVTFLVPKFHLPAHVEKCQTAFSFNLTKGVGLTDGEAPERGWSDINPLSSQTKQMGPASRRETIDDHFGDWNHKKVIGLGMCWLL